MHNCSVLFSSSSQKNYTFGAVGYNATDLGVFLLVTTRAVFFQLREILLPFPKDRMHVSDKHCKYFAYKAELRFIQFICCLLCTEYPATGWPWFNYVL
jgi:hypothetical protein